MISACTVWFTFVSRIPTPHAVEDFIVKGLSDSRGSCLLASALLPSFVSLLYHTFGDLSRGFLTFSEKLFFHTRSIGIFSSVHSDYTCGSFFEVYHSSPRLLTPLLYHKPFDLSTPFFIIYNLLTIREILFFPFDCSFSVNNLFILCS